MHQAEAAAAASAESITNVIHSVSLTNRLISAGKKKTKENKLTPSYAHEAETHPRIVLIPLSVKDGCHLTERQSRKQQLGMMGCFSAAAIIPLSELGQKRSD